MLERKIATRRAKGKGRAIFEEVEEEKGEERKMAVTALVAMIEIWMSDLWWFLTASSSVVKDWLLSSFEEAAPGNCDSLVARALSISPDDPEVRLALASIRTSQERFDEARVVVVGMYEEIQGKEPCMFHDFQLTVGQFS